MSWPMWYVQTPNNAVRCCIRNQCVSVCILLYDCDSFMFRTGHKPVITSSFPLCITVHTAMV